ncbi:MAG: exodeoxyribonuclease VII small subunit [Caldimicrobium sp.]|nr:exodeoxyribonuclease VII small subunit [Caldimicrobium sp.]MCX7612783.1 exodeoxyribonuclease VII small subunit [Caldimicrobium sp.]MDW8182135.1 exodeoxyribonuclease VII small subunit [Caldimicrobium sp.]
MREKTNDLSFEKALRRLEEILRTLDQKDLDLDTSITLFEEGLALIHFCEQKLKEARIKVEVVLKGEKGFYLETLERAKDILKNDNK